jgi:hypothetical protein
MTYVLGHRSPSGKKAQLGTMVHKVMEVLASCKKHLQDHPDEKTMKVVDDALGEVEFTKRKLYSKKFVEDLLKASYEWYQKDCVHKYYPADFKFCKKQIDAALEFNDGQFDPRKRNIVATEPTFDIPIEEDWAKFSYYIDEKKVDGQLAIKGTVDLITEIDDGIIEVVDWKGLPLSTPLPTPDGFTTMRDIEEGDIVFDQYGKECRVVGKSKVKIKDCFRITFDDKTSVVCDDEHLWKLSNGNTVPVQELKINDNINVTRPLDCKEKDLPIDPYLLGVWLGDGRNRSCEISSGDGEIFKNLKSIGLSLGKNLEKRSKTLQTRTVLGKTKKFRKLNLLNNKHIPEMYFRASFEQRLSLLRGLMDTDGNVNKKRKQAVFTTCNKRLSNDVKNLLLTLGQRPNQSDISRNTNFKKDVRIFPIAFRPIGINPFLLSRKQCNPEWGPGKSGVRRIISIEKSITQKTQCISVDSKDNTYLCTENYIPTHNTGQRKNWATGEEKTYEKLLDDPQLLLYNYAISKLYPDYDQAIMSIFFTRDGGPFSMCFDKSDQDRFLEMLRKRFEEIKRNHKPKPVDPRRRDFRCQKLCHFCKNNWPGTTKNMCEYVEQQLYTVGYDQTVKDCTREGHDIGYYESPG